MSILRMEVARIEGGGELVQTETGVLQLVGHQPREIEKSLLQKNASDAVFLTQRISANASVAHALAAVTAWEDATGSLIAHNGLLLRDFLHTLSIIHAHLRHLYFSVLPDYLPPEAVSQYKGTHPALVLQRDAVAARPKSAWERQSFLHPFSPSQVEQLLEGRQAALEVMVRLQKSMAALGGKFPMVMSITRGGLSLEVTEPLLLRLRDDLASVMPLLESKPMEDIRLLIKEYPNIKSMGGAGRDFLAVGSVGDISGPDAALFPQGVALDDRLEAYQQMVVESVESAFYRIPLRQKESRAYLQPAANKAGAYSWIKAPRYKGLPMQTGALGRLVVTFLAGSRSHAAPVVDEMEKALGLSLQEFNTVGGRLLAQAGEIAPLARRAMESLSDLQPDQPSINREAPGRESGDGQGIIEGPAGAIHHQISIQKGTIRHYDLISASTWNGSSRDDKGQSGVIEQALNKAGLNLEKAADRLNASRIIQSFAYSTSDAVH